MNAALERKFIEVFNTIFWPITYLAINFSTNFIFQKDPYPTGSPSTSSKRNGNENSTFYRDIGIFVVTKNHDIEYST